MPSFARPASTLSSSNLRPAAATGQQPGQLGSPPPIHSPVVALGALPWEAGRVGPVPQGQSSAAAGDTGGLPQSRSAAGGGSGGSGWGSAAARAVRSIPQSDEEDDDAVLELLGPASITRARGQVGAGGVGGVGGSMTRAGGQAAGGGGLGSFTRAGGLAAGSGVSSLRGTAAPGRAAVLAAAAGRGDDEDGDEDDEELFRSMLRDLP